MSIFNLPGVVIGCYQRLIDIPGADYTCDSDDNTHSKEESDSVALAAWHLELHCLSVASWRRGKYLHPR